MLKRVLLCLGISLPSLISLQSAVAEDTGLSQQAFHILKERCHRCHGQNTSQEMQDALNHSDLILDRGESTFIVPGNLEKSYLWRKISGNPPSMPLGLDGGLPEGERETIRKWILDGAKAWSKPSERTFLVEEAILKAIRDDLQDNVEEQDRPFVRYFSFAHIYNNSDVDDFALQLHRAALSKALNSLSRSATIVVPKAVQNTHDTIYRIDLREYGWRDLTLWLDIKRAYPYGLQPTVSQRQERKFYEDIRRLYGRGGEGGEFAEEFGDKFAYIRGDWFIVNVLNGDKHQFYNKLLEIPTTLDQLYKREGINPEDDFEQGQSKRAGVLESGVSQQNRLIEYHNDGAFWVSYDFKQNTEKQFLPLFPLGPKFTSGKPNKFEEFAFEQDGGEIIFELKNGLHAYMLVDGKGNQISQGPVDVVFDEKQISGSPLIVNGLSCIACHTKGLKAVQDDIRAGHAIGNNIAAVRKLEQLYPNRDTMLAKIAERNDRYTRALKLAIGPFFPDGQIPDVEPVSVVARQYERPITAEMASWELGIQDPAKFTTQLNSEAMRPLGLTPFKDVDGKIKRSQWESKGAGKSVFQNVATKLGNGTPAS